MKPEEVSYITELDLIYAKSLKKVGDGDSFVRFLKRWDYWLDDSVKNLKSGDWESLQPRLEDCRIEGREIDEEKHKLALALLLPQRIFRVSMEAYRFQVPWGCAYLRMKQDKAIHF